MKDTKLVDLYYNIYIIVSICVVEPSSSNVFVAIWKTYSSLGMKENPTMAHLGIGMEKSGRRDKSGKGGKCEEAMERGWKRQSWKRGKKERKKKDDQINGVAKLG
jgi:hypothetical protein